MKLSAARGCSVAPRCAAVLLVVVAGSLLCAADWPQFRGPTGMGLTSESGLPTTWGGADQTNVLWKVPLTGAPEKSHWDHNQSSPVVAGGRVYYTCSYWPPNVSQGEFPEHHVCCVRLADGERLWDTLVAPGPWKLGDLRGGYTASTPVIDGQRVYVVFGSAVLAALTADGQLAWRKDLADYQAFDVAIASSPILHQGKLLVLAEKNEHKGLLTAYDPQSGNVAWESRRPEVAFAHSTPTVAAIGGRDHLLVAASNALQSLDPSDGSVEWFVKTPGDVCSPVTARRPDGSWLVYCDSGRGGPGVAVEVPDTAGAQGELPSASTLWKISTIPEGLSSPVVAGPTLYRLHTPAVLKGFALTDGKERFAKRLDGVSTAASPIATADGLVYIASAGKSWVLRAGEQYDLVAENDLGDSSAASPAVSNGKLILKGSRHLFCIGKK